jgi:hypothetical protein
MTAGQELATVEHAGALAREQDLGISVEQIIARVSKIREVRDRVMKQSVHFGKIPGVKKESLFKPGAETLCMAFQLVPKFHIAETKDGDHLECVVTCTLIHAPTGAERGDGIGSCSTHESKYAYRAGERVCPDCGSTALRKSSKEKGGGFYCWAKIGGCGKQFSADEKRITEQQVGRQPNPDLADQYNTVRKMACKRAHVAATLFVTGASELFTQDVEDMPQNQRRREDPPDDGTEGTLPVGRAAAARPAPPVQAVPSDADLEKALAEIAAIPTVEGLGAHAQANRGKRWSKAQIEALKTASAERKALLEDPDYLGDPEPPEGV